MTTGTTSSLAAAVIIPDVSRSQPAADSFSEQISFLTSVGSVGVINIVLSFEVHMY